MGVVLDSRLYLLFAILTLLSGLGLALRSRCLLRAWASRLGGELHPSVLKGPSELKSAMVLGLWLVFTVLSYLWYNLQFVQHQGRYLFPALIPLGLMFSAGLSEVLQRRHALWASCLCLVGALTLSVIRNPGDGLVGAWDPFIVAGAGVVLFLRRHLSSKWNRWIRAAPYVGLYATDFVCLFAFIVPGLR
jgi:hypothetical protein